MAKCVQCGRNMPSFSFKKKCAWCEQYDAAQRGEVSDVQPVMPTPWQQSVATDSPVTTTLLVVNLLVFILMVVSGISATEPGGQELIRWGSNFGPATLGGQYWRLFTYMFLHIGIFHLIMNMFFLFQLGGACERLLGSVSYAAMYLVSGIAGGICSLAWHPFTNSAGASGALFGILGAMIAAYQFGEFSMPRAYIQASLRSMLFCAGINLLWGMTGGIDNAAHIGGFISGLAFGFLFAKVAPDTRDFGRRAAITLILACLAFGSFTYLKTRALGPAGSPQRIARLLQSGRRDEAIAELRKNITNNPNDPKMRMWLAIAYSGNSDLREALEQFQWIVAHTQPGDGTRNEAIYSIRWAYETQKETTEGVRYFEALLKDFPGDLSARFAFSQLLALQGQHEAAIAELNKIIAANPNDPAAYTAIAQSYSKLGKKSESVAAYKKAIELEDDPSSVDLLKKELAAVENPETKAPPIDNKK